MQLTLRHDLAFVTATLTYRGTTVSVPDLLVDTGAASTVINADPSPGFTNYATR